MDIDAYNPLEEASQDNGRVLPQGCNNVYEANILYPFDRVPEWYHWFFWPMQGRIFKGARKFNGIEKEMIMGHYVSCPDDSNILAMRPLNQFLMNMKSSASHFTMFHLCKRSMAAFELEEANVKDVLHGILRARAMITLPCSINDAEMFDELRTLRLCNLRFRKGENFGSVPPAMLIYVNTGNHAGKLTVPWLLRHKWAEACALSALGFYLYSAFHLSGQGPPDFRPDFSDPIPNGRIPWHDIFLFSDPECKTLALPENGYHSILKCMTEGVHAPRSLEHQNAALMDWKALNAKRHLLNLPLELLDSLFPWVEREQAEYHGRLHVLGEKASDPSLEPFLELLQHLRQVVLQDAVVLFLKHPESPMFNHEPFSLPLFRKFAKDSRAFLWDDSLSKVKLLAEQASSLHESTPDVLQGIEMDPEENRANLLRLFASGNQPVHPKKHIGMYSNISLLACELIGDYCDIVAGPHTLQSKKEAPIRQPYTAEFFTRLA